MRTFEEIKADMDKAAEMNNSERMFELADEMDVAVGIGLEDDLEAGRAGACENQG